MPEPLGALVGTTVISSCGVGVSIDGIGVGAEGLEVRGDLDPQALSVARAKKVTKRKSKVNFFILKILIRCVNGLIANT